MAASISIQNVHVFQGTRFSDPMSILIDGSKIKFQSSHTASVIDGNGGYLIPGLIDSHLHVHDIAGLEKLTSFGITTAMNMAADAYPLTNELRDMPGLASWRTAGIPAVAPNTTHARMPGGHKLISSLEQVAPFVEEAFTNGADYYKITSELNGPSQEMQDLLVKVVHSKGKKTMTHASDLESLKQAIHSGTDGIQHIANDKLLSGEMIAQILAQGQTVTPTMALFKIAFNSPIFKAIPGSSFGTGSWDVVVKNVKALRESGVSILAGTDAIGKMGLNYGEMLHQELEHLTEAGFTPAQALRAATVVAANFHQLEDRGVIGHGKRADLVLLEANPLEDIKNTRHISRIWVGGVEVKKNLSSSIVSGVGEFVDFTKE